MITNRRSTTVWHTQYDRIKQDFCPDCKYHKQEDGCPHFFFGDGVCLQFKWKSEAKKKQYQEEVLDNQATTIWLERGTKLEDIYKMKQDQLRSVLTKKHYSQFEESDKRTEELLKVLIEQEEANNGQQQINSALTAKKQQQKKEENQEPKPQEPKVKKPKPNLLVDKLKAMKQQVEARIDDQPKQKTPKEPQTHYFYCQLPNGKEVTYKRNMKTASYEAEVKSFRKYLEKQKIKIIKEIKQ